jgi:hypothetical protein
MVTSASNCMLYTWCIPSSQCYFILKIDNLAESEIACQWFNSYRRTFKSQLRSGFSLQWHCIDGIVYISQNEADDEHNTGGTHLSVPELSLLKILGEM